MGDTKAMEKIKRGNLKGIRMGGSVNILSLEFDFSDLSLILYFTDECWVFLDLKHYFV